MSGTDLSGSLLYQADLSGARLTNANLEAAYLTGANLRRAHLQSARLKHAVLEGADLRGANLSGADLQWAILTRASLQKAVLSHADLRRSDLEGADLQDARLLEANLQDARLDYATLHRIYGEKLNLANASLRGADLRGASLQRSRLTGADFFHANLEGTDLYLSDLAEAHLARSNLTASIYAPSSPPPDRYLVGIQGLRTVLFPPGQETGMVQLRDRLRAAGLRDLEREATYAIEHNKARHQRESKQVLRQLAGWGKLIFFEWTTGYGLFPRRAIYVLFGIAGLSTLFYMVPIAAWPQQDSEQHVVIRIWPANSAEPRSLGFAPARTEKMERLTARGIAVFGWALYFSLLSAFHFGWRDLNVGTWLTRIQPSEFALRGRGWVRVVSGVQSLVSVYLLALWALTSFGRPFE